MTSLRSLRAAVGRVQTIDVVFGVALCVATGALLYPLWIGVIPPLQDFGGHLALADIWTRIGDDPLLASHYALRADLSPNALHVRFAALFYPWLSTLTSLRLFTTLTLIGFVGATLYTLRVFERSRWMIFLALPCLCWGNMTTLGLVNNLAVFPPMFLSLGLAKRVAQSGRWPHAVALAVAQALAYFAHGISYVYAFGMALGVWALSARTRRSLWGLVALLPALLLWVSWIRDTEGRSDMPGAGFLSALKAPGTRILSHEDAAVMFMRESIEFTTEYARTTIFLLIWGTWLLVVWLSRPPASGSSAQAGVSVGAPVDRSVRRRLLDGLIRARAWMESEALLLLALCVTVAMFKLPYSLMYVPISVRLVTVVAVCWMIAPKLRRGSRLGALPAVAGFALSILFSVIAARAVTAIDRQEWQPLQALLAHVPAHQKITCVGARWARPANAFRQPIGHNCYGLAQHLTQGYTDAPFAHTDYNAVRIAPGAPPPPIDLEDLMWQFDKRTDQWDAVIVRGMHADPPTERFLRVAQAQAPDGPLWTLYLTLPTP
jgi:hypothetical protein